MSENSYYLSATGETPSGNVAPESSPAAAKSFIGFVPVAEPVGTSASTDISASTVPSTTVTTSPLPGEVVDPTAGLCKINLREGCYRITFQPRIGTSTFNGTMRVDKSGGRTVISGDLYRFLNGSISLPTSVASAASVTIRPPQTSIFALQLGIPIYARDKYFSYLRVTGIQMPPVVGAPCQFTLTAEEYFYTQPPPGQFNGTFPPAPGSRTVRIVLGNAPRPPGYSSVYFEGKMFQGATELGTFKMGWVSSFFRKATVEVDTLTGAVTPPKTVPALSGGGTEDFKSVFKTAGWDLNVVFDQTNIPVPAGVNSHACWTNANLHALMTSVRNPATDLDKEWHFHLIVVPAAMGCSRGIMYDQIGVPREGSASFSDDGYPTGDSAFFGTAANQMQRNVPRAFLRSASHELGHGFNQIHQEQEGGADNSIMTTTPSVADVLGTATSGAPGVFPNNINLGFNEHVRHHLIHFPDPAVRPGGMTFGSGHSSTVPQADQDRHYFSPDDLELRVTPERTDIELGEPLLLTWELVNKTDNPIPTPNDIRIETHYSYITVVNPNGEVRQMPTFVIECESSKIADLEPKQRLSAQTRLYWSSRGFAFERAGRHIIEINVLWSLSGVPFGVKARTDVWVNFPQSNTDNEAASTLLHPEVGMYVALGGGAYHLTEAVSRLNKVFSSATSRGADASGASAPAAIRGYEGLLRGLDGSDAAGSDAGNAPRTRGTAKAAKKGRTGASKSRKAGKKRS